MAWLLLAVAGLLEIGWAIGLKYTEGFTRLWPSVWTVLAMTLSVVFLGIALRTLPVGTGYAVWVGIGASLTVAFGMVTGDESVTPIKLFLLLGLIGCVIGLKLAH